MFVFLRKMKLLRHICLLCALILSSSLVAQNQRELQQLMRNRGEYYFTLSVDDPAQIQELSRICSVDGTDGRNVVAYANQQEYDKLIALGFQPELQTPPSLREEAKMWEGGDRATYEWDSYLTYSQYINMMEGFPNSVTNGANCSLVDLGTLSTTNHRRILGIRLYKGNPDGKPKFLYSSTMHGDEVTGMILMLRLINEFCTSNDNRIQNILNNVDLFIFPCTNPDGTYYGGNNSVSGARRANGNNIDLNRHFPDFDDGAHPDGASYYQDECQWMMDLAQQYLFTMGANYHGGAEIVNYPWDTYQPVHPDDAWWQYVSREYAQLCQAVNSSYMKTANSSGDTPSGITNGYAWYTITGSRQDYMNYYGQCREVTVECSNTKTPSASQLPNFWNYSHNAMLTYIEECLNGIHGFVFDAETGQPLQGVTVTVLNHDDFGSEVSTHTLGDFHRPIKGGSYSLKFSKEGYCPHYLDVTVADGQRVNLNNIQLMPGNSCIVPAFIASSTDVAVGANISFTDVSNGTIASWNWTFEGGTPSTSTAQNPSNIRYDNEGIYNVTLTVTDTQGNSETLIKNNYINVHTMESYNMSTSTVTTCNAFFYDSGGPNSNYGNSLDYTMTFNPGSLGAKIKVVFSAFNLQNTSWGSITDYLRIYDGSSTSAPEIGQYYGTNSPGTVIATNNDGALTFVFHSNRNTNASGWVATVFCEDTKFEQTENLVQGWNWWVPTLEMDLEDLQEALGNTAVLINSQDEGFARYDGENWSGTLTVIDPGNMYRIKSTAPVNLTVSGAIPTNVTLTLMPGYNWFGFMGTQPTQLSNLNLTPTDGDTIEAKNGEEAVYTVTDGVGSWSGTLTKLYPGHGYVYHSNATESNTLNY
jgi:PKD repeat protein